MAVNDRVVPVLMTLACASLLVAPPLASIARAAVNGKIAFSSNRDGNFEIYSMNPDGSGQTRLTTASGFDMDSAWSPDGNRIAFRSSRSGSNQIWIMNADGSGQTRLTNNARSDVEPSFSPDGTQIVFASFQNNRYDCYVMNSNGTGEVKLTNSGDAESCRHPSFSPDGTEIVFGLEIGAGAETYIAVMNADGSDPAAITGNGVQFWPSWSPDGTKILFQRFIFDIGRYHVFVMDSDGDNPVDLTSDGFFDDSWPAWSPDGAKIVWSANCCGDHDLRVMNANGSDQAPRTADSFDEWMPAWGTYPADPPAGDSDDDGIFDEVDEAPSTPSTRFSDVALGGFTVGDIVSVPANVMVTIADEPSGSEPTRNGVRVTTSVSGSPGPAPNERVTLQILGKKSETRLAIPAVAVVGDPENETTVHVIEDGPAELVLTLDGSPVVITIYEGGTATVVETTDENGVLVDISITDVGGDAGDVAVNGVVVPPGETLAIGDLSATLSVVKSQFTLAAVFDPSASSDGVHPLTEDVILVIGAYTFELPAGSFGLATDGAYVFNGTVDGVKLSLRIKPAKGGTWSVKANGKPVSGLTKSSPVTLRIGNDATP